MATIRQVISPRDAMFPGSNPATFFGAAGTNFPVESLAFDAATEETCYFPFQAINYGSGNITAKIEWYAASASSGGVTWGCSLAAITPNTDTQDIETKAFATENTAADSHLGTTGKRLHEISCTISNLDSVANGDWCMLRVARKVADANDTMTGDALLTSIILEYSDT